MIEMMVKNRVALFVNYEVQGYNLTFSVLG